MGSLTATQLFKCDRFVSDYFKGYTSRIAQSQIAKSQGTCSFCANLSNIFELLIDQCFVQCTKCQQQKFVPKLSIWQETEMWTVTAVKDVKVQLNVRPSYDFRFQNRASCSSFSNFQTAPSGGTLQLSAQRPIYSLRNSFTSSNSHQ